MQHAAAENNVIFRIRAVVKQICLKKGNFGLIVIGKFFAFSIPCLEMSKAVTM